MIAETLPPTLRESWGFWALVLERADARDDRDDVSLARRELMRLGVEVKRHEPRRALGGVPDAWPIE